MNIHFNSVNHNVILAKGNKENSNKEMLKLAVD